MNTEIIHFKTEDKVNLSGILYKTAQNNSKILISTHGMATDCLSKRDTEIAEELKGIKCDILSYNNRGKELVSYIKKENGDRLLSGTAYEIFEECYNDILSAIKLAIDKGYSEIYLMGHSLGSTKTVYTYNKLLENEEKEIIEKIKGIILLSLIDIPTTLRIYLNERYSKMLTYAKNMEKEKMENILMPEKSFIHPISVKTFLKYARDYKNIDFARYSETEYDYKELNAIEKPLMMRWGNIREMILQKPEELCEMLKKKINNSQIDIGYIDGANHSYTGKEKQLAQEIRNFIENYR